MLVPKRHGFLWPVSSHTLWGGDTQINYVNNVIYKGKTLLHTPMATAKETADLAWVVLSSRVSTHLNDIWVNT